MRYEYILVGEDAGLAIVTMNRPERRNALSEAHMTELIRALRTIGDAGEARAVRVGGLGVAVRQRGGHAPGTGGGGARILAGGELRQDGVEGQRQAGVLRNGRGRGRGGVGARGRGVGDDGGYRGRSGDDVRG